MRFWAAGAALLLVVVSVAEANNQHHSAHHPSRASHNKHEVHHKNTQHHSNTHHSSTHNTNTHHSTEHHSNTHHSSAQHHGHKETHHAHKGAIGSLRISQSTNARTKAIHAGTLCDDMASNCHQIDSLCTEREFAPVLRQYCKKNCGFCAAPMNLCKDKLAVSKCKQWKDVGFCHSSTFTLQMRRSLCAKTCGLCGGKIDCSNGPNKWLNECLHETCRNKNLQKTSKKCKDYCKDHKKTCQQETKKCTDDTKKYTSQCIEQTCSTDIEKSNPSQPCIDWCAKNPTKPACQKANPACTDPAKKYDPECLSTTCATNEERQKPSQQCKDFCAKTPADPACVAPAYCKTDASKKFAPECLAETCASDEQQTTPGAECIAFCQANPTAPKCDTLPDPACDANDKKFTERCLRQTCSKDAANKATNQCKLYCGRKPPNAPNAKACENVVATDCDASPADVTPECLPHTCQKAGAAGKDKPECMAACPPRSPAPFPAFCKGVNPPAVDPVAAEHCDTVAGNPRFSDPCAKFWCMKSDQKNEPLCSTWCDEAHSAALECIGIAPAPTPCDASATPYDDACAPHNCRKAADKLKPECKTWCDVDANQANAACRDVDPMPNAACDKAGQEWTEACINYSCRKGANKDTPQCLNYCRETPAATACLY